MVALQRRPDAVRSPLCSIVGTQIGGATRCSDAGSGSAACQLRFLDKFAGRDLQAHLLGAPGKLCPGCPRAWMFAQMACTRGQGGWEFITSGINRIGSTSARRCDGSRNNLRIVRAGCSTIPSLDQGF